MFTNRLFYLLIVVLLVVAACAPRSVPISAAPPTAEPTTSQPPVTATAIVELNGKFEVNGHSLYIECLGTGSPTIVMETGEAGNLADLREQT